MLIRNPRLSDSKGDFPETSSLQREKERHVDYSHGTDLLSCSFLGGTGLAGDSSMVPLVPWVGVAGIGSIEGNPGIIPDTVGTILLIFRGRIRIFPAHCRSRLVAPPAVFGLDLSCNRK